jgi:hypothetical protein
MDEPERYTKGIELRRTVLGEKHVNRLLACALPRRTGLSRYAALTCPRGSFAQMLASLVGKSLFGVFNISGLC